MIAQEEAKGSGLLRRLAEFRPFFVLRVGVLFTAWIVSSALLSLMIVTWEFIASRFISARNS